MLTGPKGLRFFFFLFFLDSAILWKTVDVGNPSGLTLQPFTFSQEGNGEGMVTYHTLNMLL